MTLESLITTITSLWNIPPVRWAVYLTIALYVLYVYVMKYKRIRDKRGLRLHEKIIAYPLAAVGVLVNWFYNLTVMSAVYRELPKSKTELTTDRFQRALDNPEKYAGYRYKLAKWWKPHLNEHDPGHLK